tara:strand:+ start:129 stop:386 length:258 start_codon:yes stop_codon:yes gene_type:complete
MDKNKAIKLYKVFCGAEEYVTTVFTAKEAMMMHKRILDASPEYTYIRFATANNTIIGEINAAGKSIKRDTRGINVTASYDTRASA